MSPTLIKICGITSVEDAQLAVSAGANYLGLIFVDTSPRRVSLEAAIAIQNAIKGKAKIVGVFQNSSPAAIKACWEQVGFDLVQLHGQERIEDYSTLPVPLMRVLSLDMEALPAESLQTLKGPAQYLLLDRPKTSTCSDWLTGALAYLASIDDCPPLFFAGGLTADNVTSVISQVRPHGVDVASGIEARPGVKDPQKLRAFCQAVQACDNALQQHRETK